MRFRPGFAAAGIALCLFMAPMIFSASAGQERKPFPPPGHRPSQGRDQPTQPGRIPREDRTPGLVADTQITISVGGPVGRIRPLLGVNAGPLPAGEPGNADLTAEYNEIGVNSVRTHDFYGPLDLSTMYPDINADPESSLSYDFSTSDSVYRSIAGAGFEPYLRIGDSYNNVRIPGNSRERANLVRAAVEVVRHYRQFGVPSFQPLTKVEILNEPDFKRFWPAGFDDALAFWIDVFMALKSEFPGLKIGGPAFAYASYKLPGGKKNVFKFLDALAARNLRPDFISFHVYSDDPVDYYDVAAFFREAAEERGLPDVELHVTEWNTDNHGDTAATRLGARAAPLTTASWIAMQLARVHAVHFYRGNDTSPKLPTFYGMFHADGRKKPAAMAFSLWRMMTETTAQLAVSTGIQLLDDLPDSRKKLKPLWMLGGLTPAKTIRLLLSNIGEQTFHCTLKTGSAIESLRISEIRGSHDPKVTIITSQGPNFSIGPLSVQLVEILP